MAGGVRARTAGRFQAAGEAELRVHSIRFGFAVNSENRRSNAVPLAASAL